MLAHALALAHAVATLSPTLSIRISAWHSFHAHYPFGRNYSLNGSVPLHCKVVFITIEKIFNQKTVS
jgi:hypothetical protein